MKTEPIILPLIILGVQINILLSNIEPSANRVPGDGSKVTRSKVSALILLADKSFREQTVNCCCKL